MGSYKGTEFQTLAVNATASQKEIWVHLLELVREEATLSNQQTLAFLVEVALTHARSLSRRGLA